MTKTKFFCMKCKNPVESEILEIKENKGRRYAMSECPTCGTDMSVVLPKDFKVDPTPYEEPESDPKVDKLNDKLSKLMDEIKEEKQNIQEKKMINNFHEEVDLHEDMLKRNNILVVKRRGYIFWIIYAIILTLIIILGIGFLGYYCYSGNCKVIQDVNLTNNINISNHINLSTPINNDYHIDNQPITNNQYNVTIINNIVVNSTNSS